MAQNKISSYPIFIQMFFFALTLVLRGQERTSLLLQDSSANISQQFDSRLLFFNPTLTISRSLDPIQETFTVSLPKSFVFSMQFNSWTYPEKIDLDSPLRLQLAKQNEYGTMRVVLGTVQLGGVAYIAYRHLKKYGLK